MTDMKFADMQQVLAEILIDIHAGKEPTFSSLCYDSRKAREGGVFVCLIGALSDGHNYAMSALAKGASALVVSKREVFDTCRESFPDRTFLLVADTRKALALLSALYFDYPAKDLFTIGITGTKGKTSTSFMIREVLCQAGHKVGVIGTTGIYYGERYEYIDNSTPESYELHRIFREMLTEGVTYVVMEVSSQALMMHRTYGICFDIGMFTNFSPDHIGENEHASLDEYFSCKTLLFRQCKKAVVNDDADRIEEIKRVIAEQRIPLVTYSTQNEQADFYGENPVFEMTDCLSTSFEIRGRGKVHVNTPGEFSVYNALAAVSASLAAGATFDHAVAGLAKVHVFGRVEPVKHEKCRFAVIIDYAHNALSMESLYRSLLHYAPKRIITVFGCGGNRSKLRRYDMGEISGKYSALSVLTSDNPRTEKVSDIIEDILVGMKRSDGKYTIIEDRKQAIFYALSQATIGDIVLIVGKGNQLYEEIGHEKLPFDEREVVKEYFDRIEASDTPAELSQKQAKTENELSDEMNELPWAVTLCDKNGAIVAKNLHAARYKLFRLRSKIVRLIAVSERKDFLRCLSEREAKLFDCERGSGFAYAATIPSGERSVSVFWLADSVLESMTFGTAAEAVYNRYQYAERILQMYLAERRKQTDSEDEHALELLANNTLRIRRATRHMDLSLRTIPLNRSQEIEPKVLMDLSGMCRNVIEYFNTRMRHTAYTVVFANDSAPGTVMAPMKVFACVFLESMTYCLRLSKDDSVRIRMTENDNEFVLTYTFRPAEESAAIFAAMKEETEFLQALCKDSGWRFELPADIGNSDITQIHLAVPAKFDKNTLCHSADRFFASELFALVDEEASVLFF